MVYNLLPNLCLLCRCHSDDGLLCRWCHQAMPWLGPACRCCALPLSQAADLCGRCLHKPLPVARSVALFRYDSWASALIHRFKFNQQLRIGHYLSASLIDAVRQAYVDDVMPAAIVPVPLHAQRLTERGFNQALEMAKPISHALALPLLRDTVQRTGATRDQIGLSALERRRNVRGVFEINGQLPKHIVLVDDVVTTGATVLALAKLAKRQGAERVDVWCVARTTINHT